MNKLGFTLVEMLAVIILLGILITFTVVSIVEIRKDSIENLYNNKITYIETGAKEWGNDNLNLLSSNCTYVEVSDLITVGYIAGDSENKLNLIDPRTEGATLNNECVCVKYVNVYENEDVTVPRFQVTAEYSGTTCEGE